MAPVKNYTPLQMQHALEAVKKGESVCSAAKKYGVPRITLHNKCTGKSPAVCSMGPSSILTKEEENILVKWLFAMSERHCPVAKEQLLDRVQTIVKLNNKQTPFTDGRPGRKWYQAFLKRHPEVSERLSQNLTTSREAVTEKQITSWFADVRDYLHNQGLGDVMKDPTRVFNTGEGAFFLNPNPGHVLVKKGDKNVYSVSGNEKENLTVLITANAAGQLAPPMIVFAYERVPKHIAESVPNSWALGKSESGWMCSSTFYEYITNIFHPWLIEYKIKLPVVFFLDGTASHVTKHLSDFCSQSQIEIITLYPNSTHLLQPMDLAVFRPLKAFWRKHVRIWKTENLGQQVKKDKFAIILKSALEELSQESIKNGFRAGGLFPFGPEYVDFSKMHAHNRRSTNATQHFTQQDSEFMTKLEQEIVKTFTQSKLDLYTRCFNIPRTDLDNVLPDEDLTLYTIWAKYKQLCHANRVEFENQEEATELGQMGKECNTGPEEISEDIIATHQKDADTLCSSFLKNMPSTSFSEVNEDTSRRTSTASEDSEPEGQHRDRLGKFTSLPPPPKRWKQSISEQNELENKTCSSFSPHSQNSPLDQQHSFLAQSVNAPLDQTSSFIPQSVNAPLDQPHSFLSQSVNAPSTVHTLTPTALYWSHKLDNLNRTQRLYAEKYINEILLEAELGNLGRNSVIINSSYEIEAPKPTAVYSICHPTPSSSDK